MSKRSAASLSLVLLLLCVACATNPATGQRQLMLMSEAQEVALGRQADGEIGGAYGLVADPELQAYVARLGATLAASSERPELPWTFRVVDDAAVNAFALPGGFIYVTRGLLTHLDSEAELVSVLGHEIGHVTARHSAAMVSRQQLATLGLGVGMVLSPELQRFGGVAQAGLGLLFLKHGRDAERQADDLGLRYLVRQGYDPREAVEVFAVLEAVSRRAGGGRMPNWLATHPPPEDRAQRLSAAIASGGLAGDRVARREYLARIDGLVFGENPREGFFVDGVFHHPDMRFRMAWPSDWKTDNQRQAVTAVSPAQDAVLVLTLAAGGSAEQAAREFFAQQGVRPDAVRRERIGGLAAFGGRFEATSGQTILAGVAVFVEHEGRVFRLLGYTSRARWTAYEVLLERGVRSFAPETDRRVLDVQPHRLRLVDLRGATSVAEFVRRHPTPVGADVIALINGVPEGGTLRGDGPAKTVTGARLPY